jgi:uncharacterized protein (UPF0248 family)
MDIIRKEDLEAFRSGAKELVDKIDRRRLEILEPTRTELEAVFKEILAFIREKKRKIYGGRSQHALIAAKNPKDVFYSDIQMATADVEFYSPEPLVDLLDLADRLHEKNFRYIKAMEAQHQETFTVIYDLTAKVCDISYVPTNIYHRIPYEEIDGLFMTSPSFYAIDHFRVLTDMLTSGWRIEKTMERSSVLFKHYPLKPINKPKIPAPDSKTLAIRKAIWEYLKNRESIVIVGEVGCKYYETLKLPSPEEITRFDVVSTAFRDDCYQLIVKLQKDFRIDITERYPFFQFTGHILEINYEGTNVVNFYHYNHKCTPYQDIQPVDDLYRIGTFSLVMLYNYITMHRFRVDKEKDGELTWRWRIQCMLEARNKYLTTKKQSAMDISPYQDFQLDCVGHAIDPPREFRMKIMRRKAARKGAYTFSYTPGEQKRPDISMQRFANTSGNPIRNAKNLKIILPGASVPEEGPLAPNRTRAEAGDEPDEELIEELEQEKGKDGFKEEKATRGRSRTREGSVNVTEAKEKTKKTKRGASKKKKSE